MPVDDLGSFSSNDGQKFRLLDKIVGHDGERPDPTQASADDSGPLTAAEQLEREIAAIETASAALQRAEPALRSWNNPAATNTNKPRPVWLLISALWLSTALITLGAVFAISAFVN